MAAFGTLTVDCPIIGCETKLDIEVEIVPRPALRTGEYSVEVLTDPGDVVRDHFYDKHAGD